jgi:hypothetical protein
MRSTYNKKSTKRRSENEKGEQCSSILWIRNIIIKERKQNDVSYVEKEEEEGLVGRIPYTHNTMISDETTRMKVGIQ